MSLISRLNGLFRGRHLDSDLDDELRSHLEMRVEQNLAAGMSEEAAHRDAVLRSLPVQQPERLALLSYDNSGRSFGLSLPLMQDLERKQVVFTGMLAWRG